MAIETVGIILTLAAVGMGSWFFLGADKTTGLAKCDSTRGKSQMENAFADAPLGKIFGLKIIQYKKISTVLTSSSEIKCTADVVLNNGTVHDLSYRFYIEDGRFYVAAQLDNGIGESDSSQVHKPLVEPESRIVAEDSSLSPPAPPPPAITTEPPAVVPAAPVVQPESPVRLVEPLHDDSIAAQFQTGSDAFDRKDYATAMSAYMAAAEQGYAPAQSRVGYLYQKGLGVSQDFDAAMNWYRKAADQGFAKAEFNVGALFQAGAGMPANGVEALRWYDRAAVNGYEPAKVAASRLRGQRQ